MDRLFQNRKDEINQSYSTEKRRSDPRLSDQGPWNGDNGRPQGINVSKPLTKLKDNLSSEASGSRGHSTRQTRGGQTIITGKDRSGDVEEQSSEMDTILSSLKPKATYAITTRATRSSTRNVDSLLRYDSTVFS